MSRPDVMIEEKEYCYVLWESGYLEEFEDECDAQHEVVACESRGMKGHVIFHDLDEAVKAMCDRLKIRIINEDMTNRADQIRRMAEMFPYAWRCSVLMGQTALLLARRKEDELEFALLISVKDKVTLVKGVSLQSLPDTLQRLLSPEKIRRVVLEKVADLIEGAYAHDQHGRRTTPPRPTESMAKALLEVEDEIFAALGRTPEKK